MRTSRGTPAEIVVLAGLSADWNSRGFTYLEHEAGNSPEKLSRLFARGAGAR